MRRALNFLSVFFFALHAFPLAIADNLICNGSFEVPEVQDLERNYEHRVGDALTGWISSVPTWRGTVQFNSEYDRVGDGNQAVQIEAGKEWISQSFNTEIGKSYTLSFDLSAYSGYGPGWATCDPFCTADLEVTVGTAGETELFKYELTGTSVGYVRHTLIFTASSPETILKFENPFPYAAWWNYPQIDNVVVHPTIITAAINIRPWGDRNFIYPRSRGIIPIAVLSNEDFNAPEQIDQGSLTFGYTGDEQSLAFCLICPEDVNGDGLGDLICLFYAHRAGFQCGDTEGILKGKTIEGIPVEGRDFINIVPCKKH